MSKKQFKPRVEVISPKNVVEVWRLLKQSIDAGVVPYPDMSEELPENIRMFLFSYIMQPNFHGMIIKKGRRPLGQVIGHIDQRVLGRPKQFFFVWNLWIDPDFRKQGLMKLLYREFFDRLRNKGIFYWEANVADELTESLIEMKGFEAKKLMNQVGGKV